MVQVVGGSERGGIIVRTGCDLSSDLADGRLATGSVVKELALAFFFGGSGRSMRMLQPEMRGLDLPAGGDWLNVNQPWHFAFCSHSFWARMSDGWVDVQGSSSLPLQPMRTKSLGSKVQKCGFCKRQLFLTSRRSTRTTGESATSFCRARGLLLVGSALLSVARTEMDGARNVAGIHELERSCS